MLNYKDWRGTFAKPKNQEYSTKIIKQKTDKFIKRLKVINNTAGIDTTSFNALHITVYTMYFRDTQCCND